MSPSTLPFREPTRRARLVRRAMIAGVRAVRRLGGGVPDPDAPDGALHDYAVRVRETADRLLAFAPDVRGVRVGDLAGSPVPGRWVVDSRVAGSGTGGRVVLHLHGGSYFMGSSTTHRRLAGVLARTSRAAVALPDYRLAPEHTFPAALEDAVATYGWLLEECGVAPSRLAVTGDSAGGGLAVALLLRLRDEGRPLPACYVGLSPWLDLAGTGDSMHELDGIDPWLSAAMAHPAALAYAGTTPLDDPLVSPLYGDPTGLPPALVHVGGHEILRDDAVRFVARCREHGVDSSLGYFARMWHAFQLFPGTPEAGRALAEVGAFVRRHTSGVVNGDPATRTRAAVA